MKKKTTTTNKQTKKTEILMNKPVYLGLSILELSKIVRYEFWYDYVKSKYGERAKLCYMDTGCIRKKQMIFIKKLLNVLTRFETSNFELNSSLSKRKIKSVIGLMKEELGEKS